MAEDTDRPQDVGRRHRPTSAEGAATGALLERYHSRMRLELDGLLDELTPGPSSEGLGLAAALSVKERAVRWDLAIKLGRELGSAIDPAPPPGSKRTGVAGGPRAIRKGDV